MPAIPGSPALRWIFFFSWLSQNSLVGSLLAALVQKQETFMKFIHLFGDWFWSCFSFRLIDGFLLIRGAKNCSWLEEDVFLQRGLRFSCNLVCLFLMRKLSASSPP